MFSYPLHFSFDFFSVFPFSSRSLQTFSIPLFETFYGFANNFILQITKNKKLKYKKRKAVWFFVVVPLPVEECDAILYRVCECIYSIGRQVYVVFQNINDMKRWWHWAICDETAHYYEWINIFVL